VGTPILAASWHAQFPADAAGSATGLASCTQYPAACTSVVLVVVRVRARILYVRTANRAGMHAAQCRCSARFQFPLTPRDKGALAG
jgi:hypothetical protein